ncbi:hypothetical protein A0J61_10770 [Choanephora cucurbitarum]|uniref:ISXO2-like transposase domain-containing protein n=1 Tax=Choanephora cucurbitarum TaxID=101091 RepID=A0A1C7MWK1_9FUNG|nr:hypothetical protein A0J61_10770 [Choanephora cucurbitarum]
MYFDDRRYPRWRCNGLIIARITREKCCNGKEMAAKKNSFFEGRRLNEAEVMRFLYGWALKMRNDMLCAFVGASPDTIRDLLRDWYQIIQEDIRHDDVEIGGPGVIVELDESKFGTRKYIHGRRVDGVWVFGSTERTDQRKCFLVTVPDRSARTLLDVIEKHVLPGSIIHTDCWKAYERIEELGRNYSHFTVNHSVEYVTDGGVHTNTIEGSKIYEFISFTNNPIGTWHGIKINATPRQRNENSMPWMLLRFIWMRKHYGDIWGGMNEF